MTSSDFADFGDFDGSSSDDEGNSTTSSQEAEVDSFVDYNALMETYLSIYQPSPEISESLFQNLRDMVSKMLRSSRFCSVAMNVVLCYKKEQFQQENFNSSSPKPKKITIKNMDPVTAAEVRCHILMTICAIVTRFVSSNPLSLVECFSGIENLPSGPISKGEVISILSHHPEVLALSMRFRKIIMDGIRCPKNKHHPLENCEFKEYANSIPKKMRTKKKLMVRLTIISIANLMLESIRGNATMMISERQNPDQSVMGDIVSHDLDLVTWEKIASIVLDFVKREKITLRVGFCIPVFFKVIGNHIEDLRMLVLQIASLIYERDGLKQYLLNCVRNSRRFAIYVLQGSAIQIGQYDMQCTVGNLDEIYSEKDGNNTPIHGLDSIELVPYKLNHLMKDLYEVIEENSDSKNEKYHLARALAKRFIGLSRKMFSSVTDYLRDYWDIDTIRISNNSTSWKISKEIKRSAKSSFPQTSSSYDTEFDEEEFNSQEDDDDDREDSLPLPLPPPPSYEFLIKKEEKDVNIIKPVNRKRKATTAAQTVVVKKKK